jgi:hypothetical protein
MNFMLALQGRRFVRIRRRPYLADCTIPSHDTLHRAVQRLARDPIAGGGNGVSGGSASSGEYLERSSRHSGSTRKASELQLCCVWLSWGWRLWY